MCHTPTKEEIERSEALRAAAADADGGGQRRDPGAYPKPRGNQELDDRELEKSEERLAGVLGQ